MNPQYFQLLFDYNAWANHRLLEACEALSPEQFTRDLRSSFSSVRDTLAHIAGGEWLYLERFFHQRSPGKIPPGSEYPDLASVRGRWKQIEDEMAQALAAVTPADVARLIHYRNTRGQPYTNPLSDLLQHLANHSTYHRGQVTTMLRQLGAKAVSLDFVAYLREKAGAFNAAEMDGETLRTLCEYDRWAQARILEACSRLTSEQFTRDLGSSFPSVRDTLTHILAAQWVWLERFHGRSPGSFPHHLENLSFDSVRERNAELNGGLQSYSAGLSAEDLRAKHDYKTLAGKEMSNALWGSLRHVVNHSTYHRGQVTTMLRQLGAEPVSTDLIYFFRERAGVPLN